MQPIPEIALHGQDDFLAVAAVLGNTSEGQPAIIESNPLFFREFTDFWCAWELSDRKRVPALLVDDMQVEYEPYVRGIIPQTVLLVNAFRKAGLPIFWSSWWRWGPEDGFFNSLDRFYGPIGWRTAANALYLHKENGGDLLESIGPINDDERKRVMHKSYSLDMFDERPMGWLINDGQGTLHDQLQKLGVDTVVQVGAWTDDCIIATGFHAFSLQYDVVLVKDGVSTASKQHFNAIEVMRAAFANVRLASEVAAYIDGGLPVVPRDPRVPSNQAVSPTAAAQMLADTPQSKSEGEAGVMVAVANLLHTAVVGAMGMAIGYLVALRRVDTRSPPLLDGHAV